MTTYDYDRMAQAAARSFIRRFKKWIDEKHGGIQARAAADLGIKEGTLSFYLKDARNCNEAFIRRASAAVPELRWEYKIFRDSVDGPWIPGGQEGELRSLDVKARLIFFDQARQQIDQLLSALRDVVAGGAGQKPGP